MLVIIVTFHNYLFIYHYLSVLFYSVFYSYYKIVFYYTIFNYYLHLFFILILTRRIIFFILILMMMNVFILNLSVYGLLISYWINSHGQEFSCFLLGWNVWELCHWYHWSFNFMISLAIFSLRISGWFDDIFRLNCYCFFNYFMNLI